MYKVWQFGTSPVRWFYARWKRNAVNWAKQLYVLIIILYSGWVVWQIVSNTTLYPRPDNPTLIQLDLLQAMAFLVAWSALLIAITIKIVNKGRDIDLNVSRLYWDSDLRNSRYADHIRDHPDIENKVKMLEADTDRISEHIAELSEEKDNLIKENKHLRQKLEDVGIYN